VRRKGVVLALLAAATFVAAPMAAAAEPQIVLSIQMEEELNLADASGNLQVVRQKAERSEPGDVLVYTLTYTNRGSTPVAGAVVDDPIPGGTVLLPGSVRGEQADVTFSVDGGSSYASFPVEVEVVAEDGTKVRKKAPAESYTHIRWNARTAMAPGESRTASFKVLVK